VEARYKKGHNSSHNGKRRRKLDNIMGGRGSKPRHALIALSSNELEAEKERKRKRKNGAQFE
jgi:hypothetical protein